MTPFEFISSTLTFTFSQNLIQYLLLLFLNSMLTIIVMILLLSFFSVLPSNDVTT